MEKQMKLLIFLTLLTLSTSTLAERRIYSKNQGDKPEVFNAQYFEGQWTVNKPKTHQHAAIKDFDQRKSPITIVFTPSGVDELNEQIRYFTDIKSISHAKSGIRLKDRLMHEIESIHYDKFLSREHPNQSLNYKQNKAMRSKYLEEHPAKYSDYDNQSMTYHTYSSSGSLFRYNTIVLFDYHDYRNMAPVPKDIMQKNIKWYKEKFGFDVINGTDFVMRPGWMSSFVYIDIVSDDLFLMYGDKNEQGYVSGFKRVSSPKPLGPWEGYYRSKVVKSDSE